MWCAFALGQNGQLAEDASWAVLPAFVGNGRGYRGNNADSLASPQNWCAWKSSAKLRAW